MHGGEVEYARECVTTPVVVSVRVPPGVSGVECGDRVLVPGAVDWEGVLGVLGRTCGYDDAVVFVVGHFRLIDA
jgi:hypothetical protein